MSPRKPNDPQLFGNASSPSTQRAARWRERRRRGVLFIADLEVMNRDLRLLQHLGYLPADAAAAVGKDAIADAIGALLDATARRCGLYAAGDARRGDCRSPGTWR